MWYKPEYRVVEEVSYTIPEGVIRKCVEDHPHSTIMAIKSLRDISRCEGPFGSTLVISLKDAKEIIEDFIANQKSEA